MKSHVSLIAKRRISEFFTKEDGHVPRKNALVAGAVVSGVTLAVLMLAPQPSAEANPYNCFGFDVCSNGETCCSVWVGGRVVDAWCTWGTCP